MSRLRRLRQQRALRQYIETVLATSRLRRWQHLTQRFALWFLLEWRGYQEGDTVENEADLAVMALLSWSQHGRVGGASPWQYVKAAVRWA